MTQRRLAEEIGTNEALVSKHISGEHQMLYETALRYAHFLAARVVGVCPADVDDRFSGAQELAPVPICQTR